MFEVFKNYHLLRLDSCLYFFGNRFFDRGDLDREFPLLRFSWLKQIHSDLAVEASDGFAADAHYTFEPRLGLVIQTADCVPILLYREGCVASVHAGWRGIASNIIAKTILPLGLGDWTAVIGPHIHNYEVGQEILPQLVGDLTAAVSPHPHPGKALVNLSMLVRRQLAACGVERIEELDLDTYSGEDQASYRRTGGPVRQLSFVARLD